MYRYNVGEKYVFCDTIHYNEVNLTIDSSKLFHLDEFNLKGENYEITYSQVRTNMYIAGILDLTKTFGNENKKKLYKCNPDDKRIPNFLIPYNIPPSFDKSKTYLYVTFQYKHWDKENPYGTMTNNIGCVNHLPNVYEYMLYCKSLNHPINEFNKVSLYQINKHINVIENIKTYYDLNEDSGHIFTIDSTKSVDFDDAIYVNDNIVRIYISNVALVLDYLNLWTAFSKRISTIYLPDKKRSMLPMILTNSICSLNEKTKRICLVKEFKFENNVGIHIKTYVCCANISRNYSFEDPKLLKHKDYLHLKKLTSSNSTNDLISKLMILYNNHSASQLKEYKKGIYKNIPQIYSSPKNVYESIEKFKMSSSKYIEYENENCDYLQITSPIRRLIDLLNMYLICKHILKINVTENSDVFYDNWVKQLDYINITTRHIRKLQSKCKLLSIFHENQHKIFEGYVFDKIKRMDERFHYNIYLPELNIFSSLNTHYDIEEYKCKEFKLFMFHDEGTIKKKLKLSII